jgi:hypothetical protein
MTENAHRLNRNHAAALTALTVVIVLVLASPFGWDYLLPQLGDVFVTAWQTITAGALWVWNNSLVPVFQFLGSIFA